MIASKVLGIMLVGAAAFGVLVSVRYLVLAWLMRDWGLALIAVAALFVFGIATLLMVDGAFAAAAPLLFGRRGTGRGEYSLIGRTVIVTITDKHWLLPWPIVEAQLRELVW